MKMTLFISLALVLHSLEIHAQPLTLWTSEYSTPSVNSQAGYDIAITDTFTYVVGKNDDTMVPDFQLFKLDNNGSIIWTKSIPNYSAPATIGGGTQSIAIDESGDIYVVGTFWYPGSNYDIVTIKYNPQGDSLWMRQYNGSENTGDYGNAITLDKSGNVLITGTAHVGGVNGDCITIKYDSDGNEIWTKTFDSGNGSWDDYGHKLAVDNENNIFAAGDFGIVKYDSLGIEVWSDINTPFVQLGGNGVHVKIDSESSVIYSTGNLNNKITKYDQAGNILHFNNYSPLNYTNIWLTSLSIDQSDKIIVSGGAYDGTNTDVVTIKYDSTLVEEWESTYPNNMPSHLSIDSDGNSYISCTDTFLLLKYHANGVLEWEVKHDSASTANKVILDNSGNIYLTGFSTGLTWNTNMLTKKYSGDQFVNFIDKPKDQLNVLIYPNPSSGSFSASFPTSTKSINVISSSGKIIETIETGGKCSMNIEIIESGFYFIQFIFDSSTYTEKMIVE